MAKVRGSLASIFDDPEPAEEVASAPVARPSPPTRARNQPTPALRKPAAAPAAAPAKAPETGAGQGIAQHASPRRDSHPGKRGVLVHIPADMHRTLRQLSVEEWGEPITQIVERGLRQYLVERGYTKYG